MYTDAHRMFLQVMTAKRMLKGQEVKSVFEKCKAVCDLDIDDLQQFVLEINKQLEIMHMAIRKAVQEEHNEDTQCFVLVNNHSTEATRLVSSFNHQELALFRKIIEVIVQAEDGCVGENYALNLGNELQPKMKLKDSENFIEKIVNDNWLIMHNGLLSISALTMAEIQPYLQEQHGDDVSKCYFCQILTFKGHRCTSCNVRVHRQCSKRYWSRVKKPPFCPESSCSEPWPHIEDVMPKKRLRTDY
ncbi:unnamed protein product [Meganyctiphanes norvegica]|uniref:Non-structural maintenance of chromosomes element 1 homolog n=1 Tax=Meganyctiphanes norvegica TaxID=48144 RepID=A0AAV2SIE7_MEGNR